MTTRVERRTGADRTATVDALRERLRAMQQAAPQVVQQAVPGAVPEASPQSAPGVLPQSAPDALAPEIGLDQLVRGMRVGAAHSIDSRSLALACLGAAMPAGAWGAIVGLPDLGIEAARDLGVPIDRIALVPHPGRSWLDVVASLAEAMPVVLAAPPGRVTPSEAARLAARLRQASSTLLVVGDWPSAASRVRSLRAEWHGLADGDGRIVTGSLLVEAASGGAPRLARITIAGRAAPAKAADAAAALRAA